MSDSPVQSPGVQFSQAPDEVFVHERCSEEDKPVEVPGRIFSRTKTIHGLDPDQAIVPGYDENGELIDPDELAAAGQPGGEEAAGYSRPEPATPAGPKGFTAHGPGEEAARVHDNGSPGVSDDGSGSAAASHQSQDAGKSSATQPATEPTKHKREKEDDIDDPDLNSPGLPDGNHGFHGERKSDINAAVPKSIRSLVHQSDSSGNQQRISESDKPVEIQSGPDDVDTPPRESWFRRTFLCCTSSNAAVPQARLTDDDGDANAGNGGRSNSGGGGASGDHRRQSTPTADPSKLLPELLPSHRGKKCLVLDLDETLVHSSFHGGVKADFVIPVAIENLLHNVYVLKRPNVDNFLKLMGQYYEVVVYTASLNKYADPLLDQLDIHNVITHRLFREHCVYYEGHYVKDLSLLNRRIEDTIIVDNSPMSYLFHPDNAIDTESFFDRLDDFELDDIGRFLVGIHDCDDVRKYCRGWREWCTENPPM